MLKKAIKLNKTPVFYSYIIGYAAKYLLNLENCDFATTRTLCTHGAYFIRNFKNTIISQYDHYSSKISDYIGRMGYCVFLIEPGFYQYHASADGLTGKEAASFFDLIVFTIKKNLPNAAISWDVNPGMNLFLIQILFKFYLLKSFSLQNPKL